MRTRSIASRSWLERQCPRNCWSKESCGSHRLMCHHALPRGQRGGGLQEITNPIETACQELGQLKRVQSESTRGRSVVSAIIQD